MCQLLEIALKVYNTEEFPKDKPETWGVGRGVKDALSYKGDPCPGTGTLTEASGLSVQKTWSHFCWLAGLFAGSCLYSHANKS